MRRPARDVEHGTAPAWSPPATASGGGRRRFLARVRGRLLRPVRRGAEGDPLQELHVAFHRQMAFSARHPDVPRRLLGWLAREGDPGNRRRVQKLVDRFTSRAAWIIARAQRHGTVRPEIDPEEAAIALVGAIQRLVRESTAAPLRRRRFLLAASRTFAAFRGTWAGPVA